MVREKDSETRKKEIVLAARKLFLVKGYDNTAITDILKAVSIAKGTFYYYFSSKEELLEVIVGDIVDEGKVRVIDALKDTSLPPDERFTKAMSEVRPRFRKALDIHNVENAKLERVYLQFFLKRLAPIFVPVVEEGIQKGLFHTDYIKESIEAILLVGYMFSKNDTLGWTKEEHEVRIQAFVRGIEKLLGAVPGSLKPLDESF